jgi:hypothetical protein
MNVRHKARLCSIRAQQHNSLDNTWLGVQSVFDLPKLEPLTTQLYLEVDAPAKIELTTDEPAHSIARAVRHALAGLLVPSAWTWHEYLCRLLSPTKVPTGNLHTSQEQLAEDSYGP